MSTEDFGDLRQLLHRPSSGHWTMLCAALERAESEHARARLLPYVLSHLEAWDDQLRVAPERWLPWARRQPPEHAWPMVRCLDLSRTLLDEDQLQRLRQGTWWSKLTVAIFDNCELDRAIVRTLGQAEHWASLRRISLRHNRKLMLAESMHELVRATWSTQIVDLDISGIDLVEIAAVQALCRPPSWPALRRLNLALNRLGPSAVLLMLDREIIGQLDDLDLSHNPIGDEGVRLLADNPQLANLTRLRLVGVGASRDAIWQLRHSPHLRAPDPFQPW